MPLIDSKDLNILIDFKYCIQYLITFLNGYLVKTLTPKGVLPFRKRIKALLLRDSLFIF